MYAEIERTIASAVEMSKELSAAEFVGETADGRVRATVSGGRELLEIWFQPRVTREIDNISLGEAVVEAVNRAEDLAEEQRSGIVRQHRAFGVDPESFLRDPTGIVPRAPLPFTPGGGR
ncbi:MAG TPA: YbaB/EbfC family nucleoid-associated protein [Micromonosporaceae bacterium]|nr:YbaB/EbfC family nucleoid-associated protein [Micromonosporaceae bacterium]